MSHFSAETRSLVAKPARWLLAFLLLATASIQAPALPRVQRYANFSISPNPLDLGSVPHSGDYESSTVLSAHFTANCSHGHVVISTTGLHSAGGDLIPPGRIQVKVSDTGGYIPMTDPVVVNIPAGPTIYDFQLQFRVQTSATDPAGTYSGTFTTLVIGGPEGPDVPGPVIQASLELEVYCAYEIQGGKCYVHLGRPFEADAEVLTLRPTGSFAANAGMYVGLNLSGVGAPGQDPIEKDAQGNLTGRIFGAMAGTVDVLGRSIVDEAFDVMVRLSWDGGTSHNLPDYFGTSPDGSVSRTLWWLVAAGAPGQYGLAWEIRLLPEPAQADGNYSFQAEIVVSPRL